MTNPAVLIVGAGPAGLTLAAELALAGVPCRILERRPAERSQVTKAFGVSTRTLELLDMRGVADRLLAEGQPMHGIQRYVRTPGGSLREVSAEVRQPDSRFPFLQNLAQQRTEHVLAEHAAELGVQTRWDCEVTALRQDAHGVELTVRTPEGTRTETAGYVVACDGAHSTIRDLVGVRFAGGTYPGHLLLADVLLRRLESRERANSYVGGKGMVVFAPFPDGWSRAVIWDPTRAHAPATEPLTAEEVRASIRDIAGSDLGMQQMRWSTRFVSDHRQAERYQVGRVLLAGDAAHVFSPYLAQGMNTGIQDAMNLGWKLAATINGWAPPALLDTYQAERLPVGRDTLRFTHRFQRALATPPALLRAVRHIVEPIVFSPPRFNRMVRQRLFFGYRPPRRQRAHPWTGQRVPDTTIEVTAGPTRLYEAMRSGRFLLLDRTADGHVAQTAQAGWPQRVTSMHAPDTPLPGWPAVLLVRPDGYAAWATDTHITAAELPAAREALRTWCGTPLGVSTKLPLSGDH